MAFENPSGRYYSPESLREPAFRCGIHSFRECSLAVRVDAGGGDWKPRAGLCLTLHPP